MRFFVLFGLCACANTPSWIEDPAGEDSGATEDPSTSTDGADASCEARVTSISPAADAAQVSPDAPIVVTLDGPIPTDGWTFEVDDVQGRVTVDGIGHTVRFDPTPSWPPDAEIHWRFEACGSRAEGRFSTLGGVIDPAGLSGLHWEIEADDLDWGAPAVASVFLPLLPEWSVDLQFQPDTDGQHLWVRGKVDEVCSPPIDVGRVDWATNPSFGVGPAEVRSGDLWLFQAMMLGTFDERLALRGFGLSALLDTRMLGSLLPGVSLCEVTEQFGEPCQPCPDGADACLLALATLDEAVEAEDATEEPEPSCDEVQRRTAAPEDRPTEAP
jgi:hypothetical protein